MGEIVRKYEVRYWPNGLGKESKTVTVGSEKEAQALATEKGLEGLFYVVYRCDVLRTNVQG